MQEFVKLVAENPELPIVALVNGEICEDDCRYWLGACSHAEVTFVGMIGERYYDDRDEFKEAYYDKFDEELTERFNYRPCLSIGGSDKYTSEEIKANEEAEVKLEAYLNEMADKYMTKVIAVYINEPNLELFNVID
jgi:hypothetical protein